MPILLESLVDRVVEEIDSILRPHGLDIAFKCKIKEISNGCVALYRGGTIVRGGVAIIWISDKFFDYVKESEFEVNESIYLEHLRVTIAHEVVHAFQDLVALYRRRNGEFVMADFNEEEAESLGRELALGTVSSDHSLLIGVRQALSELAER